VEPSESVNVNPAANDRSSSVAAAGVWRVGTLTYTRLGLLSVFFWMLWATCA
jgi:hypothetical protein